MKKIILSLAGVLAATAFAPQAAAVPAFARQTGMACNSCHAQHFPTLSSFGRAFKADGFTMMGAQGKIEGEHLSIPDTLNAGILLKAQYRKTNGAQKVYGAAGSEVTTNDGKWMFPDEYGLFFGGRLADTGTLKVGTMIEHDMDVLVGFRIPVVTDVGGVKLSVIPFTTDALGPFYGYTESSTGLNRAVRWNEHHADISAHRYVGVATGAAAGFTFMAKSDMGYVTLTRWAPNANMVDQSLSLNMLHVGVTPNISGWDTVITGEVISGTSKTLDGVTTFSFVDGNEYKATGLTAQSHGEISGLPTGLYATYANTPKSTAAKTNAYNGSFTDDEKAFTIGADVSVVPNTLHVGAAYRNGKSAALTDNALSLMATYDIAQNMALQVTHSRYSGTKYNTAQPNGTQQTSFLLETAW